MLRCGMVGVLLLGFGSDLLWFVVFVLWVFGYSGIALRIVCVVVLKSGIIGMRFSSSFFQMFFFVFDCLL